MLDRKHMAVLKKIRKLEYITYSEFSLLYPDHSKIEQIVYDLLNLELIEFRHHDCNEDNGECDYELSDTSHLVLTMKGNMCIETELSVDKRWFITTLIALFATIGAWRKELIYILSKAIQLLK